MKIIEQNLRHIKEQLPPHVILVAVSKTHPPGTILKAYEAGYKIFGENKVQELSAKYEQLPRDIQWHMIGHLQTNKVKYIAPFVHLIHAADSLKLLKEINKQAHKNNRIINCLLQVHIAKEETKFGLSFKEADELLDSQECKQLENIHIKGLMGMATNTDDESIIRKEFQSLKKFYDRCRSLNFNFDTLSMGMSSDYRMAIEEGSNMVRIGSAIFGERE